MIQTLPTLPDAPAQDDHAGFGALSTPRGNLPLKALDVTTRIDGLLARTQLRQTFANPHAEPLEATYIFPLPDRAAVTRFTMTVGSRRIEGQLQERSKARETYEQALKEGHRAAIAEEERSNVFTIRVGNLPPGETVSVELTLSGPVPVDHGEATFRFPLVVAPRYIPGEPLNGESVGDGTHVDTDAVPDASRITPPVLLPGQPSPVRLSLSVELHSGRLRFSDLRSSLHTIREESSGEGQRLTLQPGEKLDRDFILRWRIDKEQIGTGLHYQPDADDPTRGTFALTIIPPRETSSSQKPRDVVFILDRSGSMAGWKMLAARRAIGRMVDTLTDRDRFTILAFDDTIESYPASGWETATDRQRFRAVEFLAKINDRGGTELAAPLERALSQLSDTTRERVLVLVTDGQVGNEDQILAALAKRITGMRVFTLGIDRAVNEGFLKRLAGLGGGYCELVESEDRLDEVMDKVHRRIRNPLLTGLKLEPAGLPVEPDTLAPARLPDLFPGTPLVVLGRYQGHPQGAAPALCLQATDEAGELYVATISGERGEVLAPVWARGHLRELVDRYATGRGDRAALEQRIVKTSLQFGVLCRFTAFVAVDVDAVVNPGGEVKRVIQPVETPSGWEMFERNVSSKMPAAAPLIGMTMMRRPPDGAAFPAAPAPTDDTESVDGMLMEFDEAPDAASIRNRLSRLILPRGSSKRRDASAKEAAKAPALDLSAYRQRAEELKKRLESAIDMRRELGVLRLKLEELLDDLKSVGASTADYQPLADLLTALQALFAGASLTDDDVIAMAKRASEALSTFAAGTQPRKRWW